MEYITYAHILKGKVYQIGDFGAVALWFVTDFMAVDLGCLLGRIWMIFLPFSGVECGGCFINFRMKGGNGSSLSFYHFSMMQSISEPEVAEF
jgi:hypothetical protein